MRPRAIRHGPFRKLNCDSQPTASRPEEQRYLSYPQCLRASCWTRLLANRYTTADLMTRPCNICVCSAASKNANHNRQDLVLQQFRPHNDHYSDLCTIRLLSRRARPQARPHRATQAAQWSSMRPSSTGILCRPTCPTYQASL